VSDQGPSPKGAQATAKIRCAGDFDLVFVGLGSRAAVQKASAV